MCQSWFEKFLSEFCVGNYDACLWNENRLVGKKKKKLRRQFLLSNCNLKAIYRPSAIYKFQIQSQVLLKNVKGWMKNNLRVSFVDGEHLSTWVFQ